MIDNVLSSTSTNPIQNKVVTAALLDRVYPVGAIYLSVSATSPATLFGGTWERVQGTFLFAAGGDYTAGRTGGEYTHKLTNGEMPVHRHRILQTTATTNTSAIQSKAYDAISEFVKSDKAGDYRWTTYTLNEGGGYAHNNMPPYLAVYVWKRTA